MFYLFHGDNNYSKKQTLDKLVAKQGDPQMVELNTTRLDGKAATVRDIITACRAMPFLARVRLVLVENYLGNKPTKKQLDELAAFLPQMPNFTRLVFLEDKKVSAKNRLNKLAQSEKRGYAKLFDLPKGNELNRWIRQAVKARGGKIAPQAVNLLAMNVGSDLQALENEVEKLTLYKGDELIQVGDVEKLGVFSADANIFDLVDALGNRNGKKAVTLLQKSLSEGSEPFQLFAMIVRQFRLIIQTKECAENGQRPAEIAKTVGMHPFVTKKVYKQAQSFSLDQLKRIYDYLLNVDIDAKTGKVEMGTALNLLVTSLAH